MKPFPEHIKRLLLETVAFVKRHPVGVGLGLVFALYAATRLPALKSLPIFCDEAIYIRWSQQALHDGRLLVSLTDGKPPLHPVLMTTFLALFDYPLAAARLFSVFLGGFTVWGVYLVAKELEGPRLGVLSALLYVICPFALWYDRLALTESLVMPLFVFAGYFALKAAKTGNLWYMAGTAGLTGLGLLTKATAQLLFFVVPFAYLLREESPSGAESPASRARRRPLLRWLVAVVITFGVAYGIYSLLRFASDFHVIGEMAELHNLSVSQLLRDPFKVFFSNAWALLRVLFVYMTPVFFLTCLAGIVWGAVRKRRGAWFLAAWVVLVGGVTCFVVTFHFTRFFLVVLPPLVIGGAYALLGLYDLVVARWRTPTLTLPLEGGGEKDEALPPEGRGRKIAFVAVIVLCVLIFVPAALQDIAIIASPQHTWLPYEDREQFVTQWPAGWGTDETVEYLAAQSEKGEILVGAVGAPGTQTAAVPADTLSVYLFDDENVEIVPYTFEEGDRFPALLGSDPRPTFVVLNAFEEVPEGWPLEVIERFPKDGNRRLAMFLTHVEPANPPGGTGP
ncbi:MAG: glycosyltransferase family 39 protein [Actinobacteria bacterium]|nr:glycosyltransferase family 39 protein [Actinomycetota bacterium]